METLKKSRDYRRAVENGNREILETIAVYRTPNQAGKTRIGISVSRKIGKSVQRNRIKRLVREAIRRNAPLLPKGEDIVIVARKSCVEAGLREMERDIKNICRDGELEEQG